jgi:hypothetical protein
VVGHGENLIGVGFAEMLRGFHPAGANAGLFHISMIKMKNMNCGYHRARRSIQPFGIQPGHRS